MQTGRSRAAVHGIFWSLINSGLPAITSILVFTVTSRFLLPGQFGIVALAGSIVTLAGALAPTGFGDALVQHKNVQQRHLDTVFWLCFAAAAAAYGLLLLFSWPLSIWLKEKELVPLLAVLGTRLIFDLIGAVPNALLSRTMAFRLVARRTAAASLASAAVCLMLLFLGFGLWALVLSQLVASMTSCLTAMLSVSWRPSLGFDRAALKELTRFGLFSSGNRFISLLSLDQLAIGGLLGTTALGLYGFARRIFQTIIQLISGALGAVSNSLLASLQSEKEKLRKVFLIATFASAALSFPLFLGLASVSSDLVPLIFGRQWIDAVPALQCFCGIGLITCIGVLQSSLINSQGRAEWWMYYQIAQQITTLIVILLTYRFGVTVLVLAIAIKSALAWPVTVAVTIRILEISLLDYLKTFVAATISTIIMLAAIMGLHSLLLDNHAAVRLAIEIAAGGLTFCSAMALLARKNIMEIRSLVAKR